MATQSIPHLPIDVVVLILSRIPEAKALLKFKCVSKTWLSVISSPEFSKTHLLTHSNGCSPYFRNLRIMLSFGGEFLDHYSLFHLLSTPRIDPRLRSSLSSDAIYGKKAKIFGSYDGLICVLLHGGKELILWNPSMRKRKSIPDFDVSSSHSERNFGFGFDAASNDYKVVGFFAKRYDDKFASVVKVFSFKTGQWERINSHPCARFYSQSELELPFGNGKFYWVNRRIPRSVCYLELETQVYRTFGFPVDEMRMDWTLALSEQKLVYVLGTRDIYADVWIMKENNNKVFWTKVCTIDYAKLGLGPNAMDVYISHLFYVLNNGEVMFRNMDTFLIYNPKDGSTRHCEIASSVGIKACTYVESLIWL